MYILGTLVVAIICMAVYRWLGAGIDRMVEGIDERWLRYCLLVLLKGLALLTTVSLALVSVLVITIAANARDRKEN